MAEKSARKLSRMAVYVTADAAHNSDHLKPLQKTLGEIAFVDCVTSASKLIKNSKPEMVFIGPDVSDDATIDMLEIIKSLRPDLPVVVFTENPDVDMAVKYIRAGALDYLLLPLDKDRLGRIASIAEESRRKMNGYFCKACPPGVEIVGLSESMSKTLDTIKIVAHSHCNPVLILGETGTGKELAARAIHAWRCSSEDNFVAVNCAALSASLLESELFGHVKGAFTSADRDKTGLFELAGKGCIFLDEISEMPPSLQAKLLRVLQEKTFRKVGGTKDIACGATIIASSNRDLFKESTSGRFRRDLYYRLAVFPIKLSPLRDKNRRSDIPLLARYFIETSGMASCSKVAGLSEAATNILTRHDWPGNVRELHNVISRAMILEQSGTITPASLIFDSEEAHAAPETGMAAARTENFSLETAEKEFILRALKETGWQRTKAASLLGITRATLHAKLKRYDIQSPAAEADESKLQESYN